MKKFFKQLFCKHNYVVVDNFLSRHLVTQTGYVYYTCTKCGKTKRVQVFPWR